MLLPLLIFIAVFISGISFAGIITAGNRPARKSNHFSVLPNRPLSLWSFILFLFFPPVNEFSMPKQLTSRSRRHRGNYSQV
jgi:hypothetical protein